MIPRRVLEILEDVPDYSAFLTVDELKAGSRDLAAKYPRTVKLVIEGASRAGDPIEVLTIGDGPRKALLFAMPHPNEPIGSMMLEYLSRRLAEDDALRNELGYTWVLVKCVDPDGTRLNEGWFKGPFSVENYARHYYRPPAYQQVEWTFPIDHKTMHFHDPMPETRVLMGLIERERPDFLFSLHNSGFGGVYYYITEKAEELFEPFHELTRMQGLPLHLGEPEVPWATVYGPAIFGTPSVVDGYEFMLSQTGRDPAAMLRQGASSFEYARRFCDPFALICEMPYFFHPAITDTSPSDTLRRDAILEAVEQGRGNLALMQSICDTVRDELTVRSPFRDALEYSFQSSPSQLAAQEAWARADPHTAKPATVAERFDSGPGRRFYELLSLGMLVRLIDAQVEATGRSTALATAQRSAQDAFDGAGARLSRELEYTVIPIRKLVSVQLGAALLCADYARRRAEARR